MKKQKNDLYTHWHRNPIHKPMHWAVFIVTALLVTNALVNIITGVGM